MNGVKWIGIIAAGVFAGICLCLLVFAGFLTLTHAVPMLAPKLQTVTYNIVSMGDADLTYNNEYGDTEQQTLADWNPTKTTTESPVFTDVTYEGSKTFQSAGGAWLYISAQATNNGVVQCRLYVDGTLVKSTTSSGQGSIATCSLRLP